MKTASDSEVMALIQEGFRRVGLAFPYLGSLIPRIQVQLDSRVPTMGIFASGRLVVNPDFARSLSPQDLVFVLTHELYHLMLRTHERGEGTNPRDFNVAHDYIINDMLREELQVTTIPAGGLDRPGARHLSAEKLMAELQPHSAEQHTRSWSCPGSGSGEGEDHSQAPDGDVLDDGLEREWFPDQSRERQQARTRETQEQAERAMSMQALMESMSGRGHDAGNQQNTVAALRGLYRPPWELALQRWLDSVSPSDRSYARPSRRGADRSDVVLPGRKREGWMLHIVLDTSGSMVDEVPRALGAIADFCEAIGVDQVHLIQCDTEVGSDEILSPSEMADWQVTGYGGSNLTPAMLRLVEDPQVSSVIVLTDGDIEYPQQPLPYSVLWVLPAWKNPQEFTPPYGKVLAMTAA